MAETWRSLEFFGGARPPDLRLKAKEAALKAVRLELEPNFIEAWGCLLRAYQYKGMLAGALAEGRRIMARAGAGQGELAALNQDNAALGMRSVEQCMLNHTKKVAERRYVSAYDWATRYAALGENERALEWLRRPTQIVTR